MSRFNLSERIKKENAKEKEQIRLKKKHQIDQENVVVVEKLHFTGLSGRHSVLERPLSGVNGHPFFS